MKFSVITLFPEIFSGFLEYGVIARAAKKGLVDINFLNLRDFTSDPHATVDDRPYGGGPGMVLKPEPLSKAILAARKSCGYNTRVIYLSAQGAKFDHEKALNLAQYDDLILLSGRYEGIDQRIIDQYVDEELSIGDYVLSGGEIPAMAVIDAVTRLKPEVLGCDESSKQDSFSDGLLDCPHYTRPENFMGAKVPDVLLSGDHKKIAKWRYEEQLKVTQEKRPDLMNLYKDKN